MTAKFTQDIDIQPLWIRGKNKDLIKLLEDACANGYGHLPAEWSIKLWLWRN